MKTLQGMIMQHFIEKGIPLVEEISASNKLKIFAIKKLLMPKEKSGIAITKKLISENNHLHKWTELLLNIKNKMIYDSFLQGRYLKNTI